MVVRDNVVKSRPAAAYRIPVLLILGSVAGIFALGRAEAATPGAADSPPIIRGPLRSGAGRYRAALANGRVVQGIKIAGWGRTGSRPTLAGVWLFDPANPVSWIRDDGPGEVKLEGPYVEFAGGDRLPGKVSSYRSGLESPSCRMSFSSRLSTSTSPATEARGRCVF